MPYQVKEVTGNGAIESVRLFHSEDEAQEIEVPCDALLLQLGFKTQLGPLKEWGFEISKGAIKVDPLFQTSLERVWACGDITTFDGKLKLIATGYAEAAIAVAQAVHHIRPEMKIQPKYSTNTGVPGGRRGAALSRAAEAVAHLRAADPVLARLLDELGPPSLERDPSRGRRRSTTTTARCCARSSASSSPSSAARAIYGRMIERFGGRTPSPRELLDDDPEELRAAVGLSRAKVAFLRSLAEHVLDGELELDRLDELSDEEILAELTAVKGLGTWTAHMFLIFQLERPDVLAVGDLGVRRAVAARLRPGRAAVRRRARAAGRAVAPLPLGRLPAALALAGQRPGLSAIIAACPGCGRRRASVEAGRAALGPRSLGRGPGESSRPATAPSISRA